MFLARKFVNPHAIALVNEAEKLQEEYDKRVTTGEPMLRFLGENMLQLYICGLLVRADDIEDGRDDEGL